jgi:hypothetical protein
VLLNYFIATGLLWSPMRLSPSNSHECEVLLTVRLMRCWLLIQIAQSVVVQVDSDLVR